LDDLSQQSACHHCHVVSIGLHT